MKTCSKCKETKEVGEFSKNKARYDGVCNYCKKCQKEEYRENREDIRLSQKLYHKKNKEKRNKKSREYYSNNKESFKENVHAYYKKNKEKIREQKKAYREINSREINSKKEKYRLKRSKEDPIFKLKRDISSSIRGSIKRMGYTKHSKSFEILGCSYDNFVKHLNSNKYNFTVDGLYDIDHIIPTSSANTEEELIALNHYTNFQLLPPIYNRNIKKDKPWNQEHFEEWLNKQKEC